MPRSTLHRTVAPQSTSPCLIYKCREHARHFTLPAYTLPLAPRKSLNSLRAVYRPLKLILYTPPGPSGRHSSAATHAWQCCPIPLNSLDYSSSHAMTLHGLPSASLPTTLTAGAWAPAHVQAGSPRTPRCTSAALRRRTSPASSPSPRRTTWSPWMTRCLAHTPDPSGLHACGGPPISHVWCAHSQSWWFWWRGCVAALGGVLACARAYPSDSALQGSRVLPRAEGP